MEPNFLFIHRYGDLGQDVRVYERLDDVLSDIKAMLWSNLDLARDIPHDDKFWDHDKAFWDYQCRFLDAYATPSAVASKNGFCFEAVRTAKDGRRTCYVLEGIDCENPEATTYSIHAASSSWLRPHKAKSGRKPAAKSATV